MIILQFDQKYHDWGNLMLHSLALHEPGNRVLIDAVNLEPDQVEYLADVHPRVRVKNVGGMKTSPALMANRKCSVLQRAMDDHPDEPWYAVLDADFLVRRPLDDLWAMTDRAAAALIVTNGMWGGRVYQHLITPSGIVVVRHDGRPLIDAWAHVQRHDGRLDGIEPGAWFWDQVTLLRAWSATPLDYATIPMSVFANCQLSAEAAIWSANVPSRSKGWYFDVLREEYLRQKRALGG